LLGALTLLWGGNWPAMKVALAEVRPWTFRSVCLVAGGAALLLMARAGGHSLAIPRGERWPICLVASFNITAWHLLSAYGLIRIPAGRAAIIAYTMPLWAVILGWLLLGEPLTGPRGLGLLLGLGGLAVLIGPETGRVLWSAPLGALLMLGAAVCWGTGTVLMKRFRWTMPTVLLTAWQLVLGAVPVLLGALLLEPVSALASVGRAGVVATAYATLVGVVFCHYAWFRVLGMLPAGVAAIATLGIPVVGVLSSGLILGEPLALRELTALVLVVSAVGIVLVGPGLRSSR